MKALCYTKAVCYSNNIFLRKGIDLVSNLTCVYCEHSTFVENTDMAIGKSGTIILPLLQPFLQKGHAIYLDNFYSYPALFRFLHNNSI